MNSNRIMNARVVFRAFAAAPAVAAAAFAMCSAFSRCAQAQQSQKTEQTDSKSQLDSSLEDAVRTGDPVAVSRLLARGADPNFVRPYQSGSTLLMRDSRIDIATLLLQKGANIDARDDYGQTALERLCSGAGEEALKFIEFLLGHGALTNIKDNYGRTALTQAASEGCGDIVDQLVAHGADVNVRLPDGETPLMLALQFPWQYENAVMITPPSPHGDGPGGAIPDKISLKAAETDYRHAITTLLGKGADVKARSADGRTALMCAAGAHDTNDADLCLDLIHRGIDVNARDSFGRTALHYVVYYPNGDWRNHERTLAVLDVLLKNGAKVNVRDKDGKTALRYADEFGIGNVKAKLKAAGGHY